jgi:hypothetical protein
MTDWAGWTRHELIKEVEKLRKRVHDLETEISAQSWELSVSPTLGRLRT